MQFIGSSNIWAEEGEIDIIFLHFYITTQYDIWLKDLGSKPIIVCKHNPDNPEYYIDTSFKIPIFNVWSLKRLLEF